MYVSDETPAETEARLLRVLDRATFEVFDGAFAFDEFPVAEFPERMRPDAFALVRDDEHWSQLVPSDDSELELFTVFRFHFEPRLDNSGFVGWLATHLKRTVGTGARQQTTTFMMHEHDDGSVGTGKLFGSAGRIRTHSHVASIDAT